MMSQNDACVLRWSCEVSNMTSNWSTESRRRFSLNSKFRTLNTQTACLLSHVWLNTKCPRRRRRTRRRTRRRKSECRSSSRRRGSVGGWESQGWIFYSSMEPSCGCSLMCVIIQCVTHASLLNIQHSTGSDVTSVTHSETTETENLVSFRDKHHFTWNPPAQTWNSNITLTTTWLLYIVTVFDFLLPLYIFRCFQLFVCQEYVPSGPDNFLTTVI